jgi:hypothetical protein
VWVSRAVLSFGFRVSGFRFRDIGARLCGLGMVTAWSKTLTMVSRATLLEGVKVGESWHKPKALA